MDITIINKDFCLDINDIWKTNLRVVGNFLTIEFV